MKKDTETWLNYAEENLKSAMVLLESDLYNPSLQNAQQSVEKFLKAVLIEKGTGLTKTHSIRELYGILEDIGVALSITDDHIDLLDSIYLPSKYPAFSVLPKFMPDRNICRDCIAIAQKTRNDVLTAIPSYHQEQGLI